MPNRATYVDEFYVALAKSPFEFERHIKSVFLPLLSQWRITGGPSATTARIAVQEAVDALEIYSALGMPFAAQKRQSFEHLARKASRHLPPATMGAKQTGQSMKRLEAQNNILTSKFMLLDYWQAVANGDAEPDLPEDGAHWALHYFLNFEPMKVRPILELILADAANVLQKKHWDVTLEAWRGADFKHTTTYDKTAISRSLKAEAAARFGAEIKGELAVEYTGFKLKASAEAFAGARAKASGELSASLDTSKGVTMKGEIEVELGIRMKAGVSVEVLDILELEAGLDAMAGAFGKAEAELTVNYQGIKMKVGAEFLLGAKVTGTAKGTLKLGGRPIIAAKVEASATAGIGGSASANFECSLFGKVSMGSKAGLTVGVGAEVGSEIEIDFHNIKWGAANVFWVLLADAGFKNKGKKWLIPVEENAKMCMLARDTLFKMMGDLYRQNETKVAGLEKWDLIERRVSSLRM